MTFFIKRPFRLNVSHGLDDTDDDKTPEYPLRDDHPLSLHNRALLLKTCTAGSSECDTVIQLTSQSSAKPSTQTNNINSPTHEQLVSFKQYVPISNDRLGYQVKQKSSNIENEMQDRAYNERYKNRKMLRSVIKGLDLASEFKWTEDNDFKENVSLLVRSLLDYSVENVESITAGRNGFIVKKMMTQGKRSSQQPRLHDNLIDTNNNSGGLSYQIQIEKNAPCETHSVEKFATYYTISNPTIFSEHSTGMTATGFCKQVDRLDIPHNHSKMDVSIDICPDMEEKNVPPLLYPVVNISSKSENTVYSQRPSFPPILSPIKIETSLCSASSENHFVNASDGRILSPVNISPKDPTPEITDGNTMTGHSRETCSEKLSADCHFPHANTQNAQLKLSISDNPLDTLKRTEEEKKCSTRKMHPSIIENKECCGIESKRKVLTVLSKESSGDEIVKRRNKSRDNLLHIDSAELRELNKSHCPSRINKSKHAKTTLVPKSRSETVCTFSSKTTSRNQMYLSTDAKTVTSGKSSLCYPYSVHTVSVNNRSNKNVQESVLDKFNVGAKNLSSVDITNRDVVHVTAKSQNIQASSQDSTQKSFGMTMSSVITSNISQQEIVSTSSNSLLSSPILFPLQSLRHDLNTHTPMFASAMSFKPLSLVSAPEKTLLQTTIYDKSQSTSVPTTVKYSFSVDLGVSLPHKPILQAIVKNDSKLLENPVDVKNINQRPPETHKIVSSLAQETMLALSTTDPITAKLYVNTNNNDSLESHYLPSQIKVEGSCEVTDAQNSSSVKLKSFLCNVSGENSSSDFQTTRATPDIKGILNLKEENFKTVTTCEYLRTSLHNSPSSSTSGRGQSEPLDLSGKHFIRSQKNPDKMLYLDLMTALGNGSHQPSERNHSINVSSKEVSGSNEFKPHYVEASSSGDGRKCDDLMWKTGSGDRNISYSTPGIYRLHETNSINEYLKSDSEYHGRQTQTMQQEDKMKELSLLHEPNLVVNVEEDDWETSLVTSNSENIKIREFPVKNYFSSYPDENSYSYLAYAAITSKRKKSLVSCNIPTENEDFLGFLRRGEETSDRKVKSIHSNSADSMTSMARNRNIIDLTEENEDIMSISSDETIEDMNIVLEPKFMLKNNGIEHSPEDKTCKINSESRVESCYINDSHANRISSEFTNNDLNKKNMANISEKRNNGSEIMLLPIRKDNIKNFVEPYKFELDQQINRAYQEPSSDLESSKLCHIKEQTLTFSGSQKALMAKKIQEIISRNSRLLPEDMRPSATLLPKSALTNDQRSYMPGTSEQRMTPTFQLPTEESQSGVEYHDTHSNEIGQLSEDAISLSSYQFGRVLSSELAPIGSIQSSESNIATRSNLINSHRVHMNNKLYLDTDYRGSMSSSQIQIPKNDETSVEPDTPYKTVWQTHFITKKEKEYNSLDRSLVCSNPEDQEIVQRLQLMHNATNKLNQVSHSIINQGSLTDSGTLNNKRRRSFTKRENQILRNNTFSDPESVPYLPDHIPSALPSTTRQLNQFITSPFVVAPYYAMAYPLCYPTFQGANTSNQPILLSPHTAALDVVENKFRRSNGRKRTRKEKPPSESPIIKRRPRNIRKNKGCVRENADENISKEITPNSPSNLPAKDMLNICQDMEKNVNGNTQNCAEKTLSTSKSVNNRNPMEFLHSYAPTNEGSIQELLGSESDQSTFLLQTRNEDGLTILSMKDTRKSESNDTKTKDCNNGVEGRLLFQDSYRVDLDLLHSYSTTASMELPVISQCSSDDMLSTLVHDPSVTETLGQNLDTLALASERHEQMANLSLPPPASCKNGYSDAVPSKLNENNVFLLSRLNRNLDEVFSSQSDNHEIKKQSFDSLSHNGDTSALDESQKHGIAEKEKLVTEMLAAMMHNRNLSAGDKVG